MSNGSHLSLHSAFDVIEGVEQGQLVLQYQPLTCLRTGRIDAVEALVRWAHPSRGLLQPDSFLPQAQRSRVGRVITSFVLRTTVAQWFAWRDRGLTLGVAVNVPPSELTDATVPEELAALVRSGFDPACLTVEVTEGMLADISAIAPTLLRLSEQGVRLSIDDFGTGDSTLTRLQRLRFDQIKIDKSFTARMFDAGPARNIVRFATDLAHSLEMDVVAEGVESVEQVELLRELDVDLVQGFHFSQPLGASEVLARVHATC